MHHTKKGVWDLICLLFGEWPSYYIIVGISEIEQQLLEFNHCTVVMIPVRQMPQCLVGILSASSAMTTWANV